LFFLLSILWYLKADMPTASVGMAPSPTVHCPLPTVHWPLFYWLSLAAFVLAMLGKGSVMVLPVLLLAIAWWLRPLRKLDLIKTAPFFLVAAALAGVNVWFQTHGTEAVIRNAGFAERLLGAGGVVWFYLYKALVPLNLVFIYPQWRIEAGNPLWWAPLLAALAVTAVLWRYQKGWGRPLLFAWGFFCVALAPVLGFQDVGFMKYSLVADRYQHIAIIGVISLASAGFVAWQKRTQGLVRRAATVVAVAAAGILLFLTWRQSECYHDNITLYRTTLAINPECWMAHNNLGVNLARAGQLTDAIEHYQQAFRLKDNYPEAHNNLGNALVQIGRPDEAVEHYRQALRLQGDYPEAHDNLLNALAMSGRPEEAINYYTQALRLNPDNPKTHFKLGNVFAHAGRQAEAIEHYQRAFALAPEYEFDIRLRPDGPIFRSPGRGRKSRGTCQNSGPNRAGPTDRRLAEFLPRRPVESPKSPAPNRIRSTVALTVCSTKPGGSHAFVHQDLPHGRNLPYFSWFLGHDIMAAGQYSFGECYGLQR
ncbi:MAG: tetratricopeptide repeat protein, partial [Thermoguttaceae bacterium]